MYNVIHSKTSLQGSYWLGYTSVQGQFPLYACLYNNTANTQRFHNIAGKFRWAYLGQTLQQPCINVCQNIFWVAMYRWHEFSIERNHSI